MPRFHFTRDEIGLLKNGLDEVTRAAKKATKALDALGLVDMRVAGYETLAEVVNAKTKDALGEGDGCDVEFGIEETQTARLGCTLLLTSYAKLAETEVSLFVDTAATHDRANDVCRVRDKLDGQGIIVEEPKKARKARRDARDDNASPSRSLVILRDDNASPSRSLVILRDDITEVVPEAEQVVPRAALANPDAPNESGYTDGDTRVVTDPPTDGDNRVTLLDGESLTVDFAAGSINLLVDESLGAVVEDNDDFDAPDPRTNTSDMLADVDAIAEQETLDDETIDQLAEQEILKIRTEDEAAPMVIPHVIVRDKSPNDDEAPKGKVRRATLEEKVKAHGAASKTARASKRAKAEAPRKITPAPKPTGKKKARGGATGGEF